MLKISPDNPYDIRSGADDCEVEAFELGKQIQVHYDAEQVADELEEILKTSIVKNHPQIYAVGAIAILLASLREQAGEFEK